MPAEKFWKPTRIEGDEPDLTISWGDGSMTVNIGGIESDRSGVNRAIRALRRARDATFGPDA